MNWELIGVQAGFRKGRGTRDQIANILWITEKKQENSRKTSASLTELKPLTVWITKNCEKFLKRWEYRTTLPVSWETCMQIKKQQLELDKEQWIGSKLGKEHVIAVYCYSAHLTYTQSVCVCVWVTPSCLTLCDPRDSSPPGSSVPGILQARIVEWVAISFSNAWKWKVKMKSLSCVWL